MFSHACQSHHCTPHLRCSRAQSGLGATTLFKNRHQQHLRHQVISSTCKSMSAPTFHNMLSLLALLFYSVFDLLYSLGGLLLLVGQAGKCFIWKQTEYCSYIAC